MKNLLSLTLIILVPSLSLASNHAGVSSCVSISDDSERLACYDSFFAKNPQPNQVLTNLAPEDTQEVKKKSEVIQPKFDESMFGLESKFVEYTPDTITSVAIGSFSSWEKKMNITLENGQVWQIKSSGSTYFKVENPKVTLEKGALGAIFLGVEGLNKRFKVKRIK